MSLSTWFHDVNNCYLLATKLSLQSNINVHFHLKQAYNLLIDYDNLSEDATMLNRLVFLYSYQNEQLIDGHISGQTYDVFTT